MIPALIIAFFVLLFGAALFSALECALFTLREQHNSVQQHRAKKIGDEQSAFLLNPASWLQELLLFSGVADLLLAVLGINLIIGPLHSLGWNPWLTAPLVFGAGLLVVEIVPQVVAFHSPERVIVFTLPVFMFLRRLFSPLTNALTKISDALLRSLTPHRLAPNRGLVVEEIETLIEMREEQRAITADEAAVLKVIVALAGLTVKDCMTPRVDLPLMPHDSRDDEAWRMIESARLRFVPVFDEKLDVIASLVDTQAWRMAQRPAWQTIAQPPVLVPETMSALDALQRHLTGADSAVVIVDEYGGLEGLLTHSNIVERLISKVAPLKSAELAIQPLGEGRYLVNGTVRIDEINRELGVKLAAEGMDTIGGLVFTRLGYLPHPGAILEIGNVSFKVKRTGHNRIQQIELRVHEEVSP